MSVRKSRSKSVRRTSASRKLLHLLFSEHPRHRDHEHLFSVRDHLHAARSRAPARAGFCPRRPVGHQADLQRSVRVRCDRRKFGAICSRHAMRASRPSSRPPNGGRSCRTWNRCRRRYRGDGDCRRGPARRLRALADRRRGAGERNGEQGPPQTRPLLTGGGCDIFYGDTKRRSGPPRAQLRRSAPSMSGCGPKCMAKVEVLHAHPGGAGDPLSARSGFPISSMLLSICTML